MNRQDHMNPDERVDNRFMTNFRAHLLWPMLAVIRVRDHRPRGPESVGGRR
jgi:hypothetical protein